MTRIAIAPAEVRTAGLQAVACGDDVQAQAAILRGVGMPDMPAGMAAQHEAAINAVASRLTAFSGDLTSVGEELQVRAAAAELADAPGEGRATAAGTELKRSIATIVGAGGATTVATLTKGRGSVMASTTAGLRLTIPDALGTPGGAAGALAAAADPHDKAQRASVVSRNVEPHQPVGGAPAAAVHQAAAGGGGGGGMAATSPLGAASVLQGDAIDPADMPTGEHRAETTDRRDHDAAPGTPAPADMPAPDTTERQDWACWMASEAAKEGLPPTLPVMLALAHSGMRNLPGGEEHVGLFGIDPGAAYAPAGFGVGRETRPDADWWMEQPDAQLEHVVRHLSSAAGGDREAGLNDADALSRWAADATGSDDPTRYADAHGAADELVSGCKQTQAVAAVTPGGTGGGLGGGALDVAKSQLGVHEVGANAGPKVDAYLASADVASGNPWCASFVTWSLQESGHEMPGTGWAAVATWVNAAEAGQHGLSVVDAAHARPGDIVAYDWGGQADFGSDGHIGFLDSEVGQDGRFRALEGNAQDAVVHMDRNLGMGNVVFLRMAG